MTLLKRLDNIDVLCADLDSMASFYQDVLGQPFLFPYTPGDDLDAAIGELDGKVEWTSPVGDRHHPTGTWCRSRCFRDSECDKMSFTELHGV